MPTFIDLTGRMFGRLTVLQRADNSPHKQTRYLCQCRCGKRKIILAGSLRIGETQSCGCLNREIITTQLITHGYRKNGAYPQEYRVWAKIKDRCFNPRNKDFPDYGQRGITICARWKNSFAFFLADVGKKPTPKHSIDRKNNDGHYSCGQCPQCRKNNWTMNCRWLATQKEQMNNTRRTRMLTYRNETLPLTTWAERTSIRSNILHKRIGYGWTIEKTLTTPIRYQPPRKHVTAPQRLPPQ